MHQLIYVSTGITLQHKKIFQNTCKLTCPIHSIILNIKIIFLCRSILLTFLIQRYVSCPCTKDQASINQQFNLTTSNSNSVCYSLIGIGFNQKFAKQVFKFFMNIEYYNKYFHLEIYIFLVLLL